MEENPVFCLAEKSGLPENAEFREKSGLPENTEFRENPDCQKIQNFGKIRITRKS